MAQAKSVTVAAGGGFDEKRGWKKSAKPARV